jgi:alkanesulfonate monooxygenase SsuD/methylene tetrahydromethanopterin reductase-like flavin-dependent oxidoreductase (luciferase family)
VADHGAGWIFGGGGADLFTEGADPARHAWREAGRAGEPRLVANSYVSLGDDAAGHARRYLGDYYAFLGDFADLIIAGALTSPRAVADAITAYTDAGCDELILFPCNPDLGQIALIAEAARL